MWPTEDVRRWRGTVGSPELPTGPAMTALRSVVAPLASLIRFAGIIYIVVQVIIWHSFYAADGWRLAAPAVAVAWGAAVIASLRRRWPSLSLVCADSAVYLSLAISAQACVPPTVRDDTYSWLVITMSGQLIVPAWFGPGALSALLTLIAPAAYWLGAVIQPMSDLMTLAGATFIMLVVGLVHTSTRRELYGRAEAADATLDQADRAAGQQYAVLARNIERREHERLLHDTVLNTLTALARSGADDPDAVTARCRQDVALIEDALGQHDDASADVGRGPGDLPGHVRALAASMLARGLDVHVVIDDDGVTAVPAWVAAAIANATREALSNVAAHASTGEAWVQVRLSATAEDSATAGAGAGDLPGDGDVPARVEVTVRDQGVGFDPTQVDHGRLGLRRSIAERAADCGGQASFWSAPGQGTVVRIAWPASAPLAGPDRETDPGLHLTSAADRAPARSGGGPAEGDLAQRGSPW